MLVFSEVSCPWTPTKTTAEPTARRMLSPTGSLMVSSPSRALTHQKESRRCDGRACCSPCCSTAEPAVLHEWFDKLCVGGRAIDPLVQRPWDGADGQVTDRHGLRWLIGYESKA